MVIHNKMSYDPVKFLDCIMLNREIAAREWIKNTIPHKIIDIMPLAGDASFRRYYRIYCKEGSRILMDAPPEREPVTPFIHVAACLGKQGVKVPFIHAVDEHQGFVLLEDLGDVVFLKEVTKNNADDLYKMALCQLLLIQQTPCATLPVFDELFMRSELALFTQWFLEAYLKLKLSLEEQEVIQSTFTFLIQALKNQPQVFIHRDYHSRNLMVVTEGKNQTMGVLDFQDAMAGPFAYDLVSLLKDCYIQWPRNQILSWLEFFYAKSPVAMQWSLAEFIQAFDWCGLQRHLKVLGIFSRLYLRDNKPQYLKDLSLTLQYVMASLEGNQALLPFYRFLQERVKLP